MPPMPWSCWPRHRTRPRRRAVTIIQISAAVTRARRRNLADKAARIHALLRGQYLGQPKAITAAYADTTRAAMAVLPTRKSRPHKGRSMRISSSCSDVRSHSVMAYPSVTEDGVERCLLT
jgi:hypothetical protein